VFSTEFLSIDTEVRGIYTVEYNSSSVLDRFIFDNDNNNNNNNWLFSTLIALLSNQSITVSQQ